MCYFPPVILNSGLLSVLTYEINLDWVKNESFCRIYSSKIISFKSYSTNRDILGLRKT